MKEKEYDVRYEELLEELHTTQLQLAGVSAARFDKATLEKLDEIVDLKAYEVATQAKKYGQRAEIADSAIKLYKEGLEAVRAEFATGKNAILIENANLNRVEIENLADARKMQLEIKSGKLQREILDKKEEMLKACKEIASAACEGSIIAHKNVEEIAEECNDFVHEITEDKSLVQQEKQSRFAAFWSEITARFNGKKKYKTEVLEPLQNKSEDIKENKVPKAKQKVEESLGNKIKGLFAKMQEKVAGIREKLSEKLEAMHINKKSIQLLLLAASGVGVAFRLYSPISFGLDMASTIGGWLNEQKKEVKCEVGEPALA